MSVEAHRRFADLVGLCVVWWLFEMELSGSGRSTKMKRCIEIRVEKSRLTKRVVVHRREGGRKK